MPFGALPLIIVFYSSFQIYFLIALQLQGA